MKKVICILAAIILAATLSAQEVYVLNAHSKLELMTEALTMGNKQTKSFPKPAYSLVVDGKTSALKIPAQAIYFYLQNPTDINVRSWKLVKLKSGSKTTRHLPYLKTKVVTNGTSYTFSGGGMTTNNGYNFETYTELDDIALRYEKISENLYKLYPTEKVSNGEYALVRMDADKPVAVYDFSADKSLSPNLIIPKNEMVAEQLDLTDTPKTERNAPRSTLLAETQSHLSDVDTDIPSIGNVAENTFALIISNENYKRAEKVPFALNDGNIFGQYLRLTFGVPDSHITQLQDASYSDIKYALNHLKEISESYDGKTKIIVYYSGHGIPDEKMQDGYILPVDGYYSDPSTAVRLSDFYNTLNAMPSSNIIVFMDACFSGAQRSGDMIASARGVAIKVKEEKPVGNMIVISAAQGDQTAYPYNEKEHGLMTYFLLKKLKETSGKISLGELSDYITTQVKRTSLLENGKSQVPVTSFDENNKDWRNITL